MYDATPLAAALGFPVRIPTAPITRSVRMLFKERATLEPYQEKKKGTPIRINKPLVGDGLSESQRTILKIVNKGGKFTGAVLAAKTSWTRNHCSTVLAILHKLGYVQRRKESGNHTRWYVYFKVNQ